MAKKADKVGDKAGDKMADAMRATNYYEGSPLKIHLNPNNPRALSSGLTQDFIAEYSRGEGLTKLDPNVVFYLPGLQDMAAGLYEADNFGLRANPVTVREDGDTGGEYVIVDGDRRLAASRMIQQGFIHPEHGVIHNPDWVVHFKVAKSSDFALSVLYNGHRSMEAGAVLLAVEKVLGEGWGNLNAEALADKRKQVAKTFQKSLSWVGHVIMVLESPVALRQAVVDGKLSFKSARTIAYQPDQVVGKLLEWLEEQTDTPVKPSLVLQQIRVVRADLGLSSGGFEAIPESDEDVTPDDPGTGNEGNPKKAKKAKDGGTSQSARRSVKDLKEFVTKYAGSKDVKAREKDSRVVSILTAIRLYMAGELDDNKTIKAIRGAVNAPAPVPVEKGKANGEAGAVEAGGAVGADTVGDVPEEQAQA